MLNLILRNNTQNCKFEKKTDSKTSYIQTDDKFVISSEPNLDVRVTCVGKKSVTTKLSQTGLGIFASACGLKSKNFHWHKSKLVEKATHIKMYLQMPDVNISLEREESLSKLVDGVKVSVNGSKEWLAEETLREDYYSLHKHVIHTYVPLSCLLIIGLAAALGVVMYKYRGSRRTVGPEASRVAKATHTGLDAEGIELGTAHVGSQGITSGER